MHLRQIDYLEKTDLKIIGKSLENHWKTIGTSLENHWKIIPILQDRLWTFAFKSGHTFRKTPESLRHIRTTALCGQVASYQ
jgi:hypothetical protein